jgi:hypothetical protein
MGTSGDQFSRIEIVHNFKLFWNAEVITLPWLSFNVWKKRIQRFLQFLQDFWEGH